MVQSLVSITDIGSLALLLALIHFYSQPAADSVRSAFGQVIQGLQEVHFLVPLLIFLLLFVAKNLGTYLTTGAQFGFIYQVASRIAEDNMFRYLKGPYRDYAEQNAAAHISRISYQPMEFSTYLLSGIQQMATEIILTGIAVIAILVFNAKLFLLLLLILVPPVIIATYFSKKRLNAARNHVKESAEQATQHLHEALASYVESNIFNKRQLFTKRYAGSQRQLSKTLAQLQITQAMPQRFIEVFAVLGLLLLILVNRYSANNAMELVNIGAFMAAAYKIIPGITRMANIGAQMRMYGHTADVVEKTMHESPEGEPAARVARLERVGFENVSFRYGAKSILSNVSFTIRKGDFVGVSSPSGRGKTTMLHLLLGFLKQEEGTILINNAATTDSDRKQYWQRIAYVKQQPFLMHDTIERNITLDENQSDPQRLGQAVNVAGLQGLITHSAEGMERVVSDGGKNISGGQRQRIALARALYKDADLLILDEPFSELDSASEQAILKHLQILAGEGKMVILVTHNKTSLQFCNKTISIDG
jgi:ABC-type multidrug transport system fused ATPase/permease subunit